MQDTKSKIDSYFNNNNIVKNNVSLDAILKLNTTTINNEEKDSVLQKNQKLEGTMKLLKNISSKSVVNIGSFTKVYNKTNNKILIKKQNCTQSNGKNILQQK